MYTTRPNTKVPARKVSLAHGVTAHVPAVELLSTTAAATCWCAACSHRLDASAATVTARRVEVGPGVDPSVFDVVYCSAACRARFLGGAR